MGCEAFGREEVRAAKVTKPPPGLAFFFFKSFYELFLQGKEETLSHLLLFLFQLSSRGFYGGRLVRFAAFYDD